MPTNVSTDKRPKSASSSFGADTQKQGPGAQKMPVAIISPNVGVASTMASGHNQQTNVQIWPEAA
jgi:hypothetical protein